MRYSLTRQSSRKILGIFDAVIKNESSSGVLLLICVVFAVLMATVPGGAWFDKMWDTNVGISVGHSSFNMSLRLWINDGLMALFFFYAGLEIKEEMISGHLSSFKRAILPVTAALGGMIFPAIIYSIFNYNDPETFKGWGIPMATDIAFAIGILALLGKKVPVSLKIFLTALAVADDLGAIIVLALFYPTHDIQFNYLLYVAIVLAIMFIFNKTGLKNKYLYLLPGIVMWYFMFKSGIHATVAGVLTAMMVPGKSSNHGTGVRLPLLLRLEHKLQPTVDFIIMPLFALANAGVALNFSVFGNVGIPDLTLGIFFGLLIGKPLGIFLFSFISIKCGLAVRPDGASWKQLAAIGILGGIGFTMSIFVNNLAFRSAELIDIGKISILMASATSAAVGLIVLQLMSHKKGQSSKNAEFINKNCEVETSKS